MAEGTAKGNVLGAGFNLVNAFMGQEAQGSGETDAAFKAYARRVNLQINISQEERAATKFQTERGKEIGELLGRRALNAVTPLAEAMSTNTINPNSPELQEFLNEQGIEDLSALPFRRKMELYQGAVTSSKNEILEKNPWLKENPAAFNAFDSHFSQAHNLLKSEVSPTEKGFNVKLEGPSGSTTSPLSISVLNDGTVVPIYKDAGTGPLPQSFAAAAMAIDNYDVGSPQFRGLKEAFQAHADGNQKLRPTLEQLIRGIGSLPADRPQMKEHWQKNAKGMLVDNLSTHAYNLQIGHIEDFQELARMVQRFGENLNRFDSQSPEWFMLKEQVAMTKSSLSQELGLAKTTVMKDYGKYSQLWDSQTLNTMAENVYNPIATFHTTNFDNLEKVMEAIESRDPALLEKNIAKLKADTATAYTTAIKQTVQGQIFANLPPSFSAVEASRIYQQAAAQLIDSTFALGTFGERFKGYAEEIGQLDNALSSAFASPSKLTLNNMNLGISNVYRAVFPKVQEDFQNYSSRPEREQEKIRKRLENTYLWLENMRQEHGDNFSKSSYPGLQKLDADIDVFRAQLITRFPQIANKYLDGRVKEFSPKRTAYRQLFGGTGSAIEDIELPEGADINSIRDIARRIGGAGADLIWSD